MEAALQQATLIIFTIQQADKIVKQSSEIFQDTGEHFMNRNGL